MGEEDKKQRRRRRQGHPLLRGGAAGKGRQERRRRRRQGHPLLRGGAAGKGRRYTHGFSASQMLALAAVCGAVAPSLPPDSCLEDERHGGRGGGGGDVDVSNGKAVRDFLVASAADPPVPDEIDESSNNPHWRAVGYSPPTDEPPAEERPEATKRPLDDGVVETINLTDASLPASLADKGLTVTDDAARNVCQVECDVVIVGSGAGGGVAAAVLAGAGHKVVVIEKGSYFTSRDYTSFEGPSMNQLYESGGFVSTMNGGGLLLAGSTVGGGTAVNWSACLKTPEHVRREWAAAHGLPLFESSEYAAAMDKVFERLGVTSGCKEEGLQNKVLRKGCEKLGYKVDAVARNSSEGAAAAAAAAPGTSAARTRRGWSTRSTNPAIKRTLEVRAKVTVSAGGSLLTPVLLQRSGLTNPHIGKNLHLHPTAFAWGYFPDTTVPDLKGKTYEGGIITSLHKSRSETWSLFCSAHNMGSCRMGATARDGAVDGRGESWEAERLSVCDGSVLPTALGVNPMITIQSVAYCLASGIADSLSGKTTLKKT
uniref:Long-chain-alcohol oxidase n=1 Tax=Oryza brachyantha TaxID=4533 RepID=J3LEX1_ORYBR